VHGVVWAIQHNPNAYYAIPVSVQQAQNSYVPFSSILIVLGGTAYAGDIIAVILQWCMLFMVCFVLPLVVPPAPSPQIYSYYIYCWWYQPAQDQRTLRPHTSGAKSLLVAFCTWLAPLFKCLQPFFHLPGILLS
jgi:hypothetical protein